MNKRQPASSGDTLNSGDTILISRRMGIVSPEFQAALGAGVHMAAEGGCAARDQVAQDRSLLRRHRSLLKNSMGVETYGFLILRCCAASPLHQFTVAIGSPTSTKGPFLPTRRREPSRNGLERTLIPLRRPCVEVV